MVSLEYLNNYLSDPRKSGLTIPFLFFIEHSQNQLSFDMFIYQVINQSDYKLYLQKCGTDIIGVIEYDNYYQNIIDTSFYINDSSFEYIKNAKMLTDYFIKGYKKISLSENKHREKGEWTPAPSDRAKKVQDFIDDN